VKYGCGELALTTVDPWVEQSELPWPATLATSPAP
jgi:hypothetical protein